MNNYVKERAGVILLWEYSDLNIFDGNISPVHMQPYKKIAVTPIKGNGYNYFIWNVSQYICSVLQDLNYNISTCFAFA